MAKPFKFRYVHEIVGAFVLLTVGVVLVAAIVAGRSQGWFEEQRTYLLLLPPDQPTGLRAGSDVDIYGTTVGAVRRIALTPEGQMSAEIRVQGDLLGFVGSDSVAVVRKRFGVAGDAYVEITRGTGDALPSGQSIPVEVDEDLTVLLQTAVRETTEAVKATLFQVNRLLYEHTELADDLKGPVAEADALLMGARELLDDLRAGKGAVGQLLTDPSLADHAEDAAAALVRVLEELESVLLDLSAVTKRLPPMADQVAGELDDLPGTIAQSRETLREVERLVEGLQRHWLLRGAVGEEIESDLRLSPAAVGVRGDLPVVHTEGAGP